MTSKNAINHLRLFFFRDLNRAQRTIFYVEQQMIPADYDINRPENMQYVSIWETIVERELFREVYIHVSKYRPLTAWPQEITDELFGKPGEFRKGDRVEYLGVNGWPGESKNADTIGLLKGHLYNVIQVKQTDMTTILTLQEFDLYTFNAVMFRRVNPVLTLSEIAARGYCEAMGWEPDLQFNDPESMDGVIIYKWQHAARELLRFKQKLDIINKYLKD